MRSTDRKSFFFSTWLIHYRYWNPCWNRFKFNKSEKKNKFFVIVCHRFIFNFHLNFLVKKIKKTAKLWSDIPEDISRNRRIEVKHIFIASITSAIVTITKRTFPVTADIATMRFLSEGRRWAFRYFTSIGSRLSPLEATL